MGQTNELRARRRGLLVGLTAASLGVNDGRWPDELPSTATDVPVCR